MSEMVDAVSDLVAQLDLAFAFDDLEVRDHPSNLECVRDLVTIAPWRPSLGPELWKFDGGWISCGWVA